MSYLIYLEGGLERKAKTMDHLPTEVVIAYYHHLVLRQVALSRIKNCNYPKQHHRSVIPLVQEEDLQLHSRRRVS